MWTWNQQKPVKGKGVYKHAGAIKEGQLSELSGLKPGLVELIPVSGAICSSSQETKNVHQAEDRFCPHLCL